MQLWIVRLFRRLRIRKRTNDFGFRKSSTHKAKEKMHKSDVWSCPCLWCVSNTASHCRRLLPKNDEPHANTHNCIWCVPHLDESYISYILSIFTANPRTGQYREKCKYKQNNIDNKHYSTWLWQNPLIAYRFHFYCRRRISANPSFSSRTGTKQASASKTNPLATSACGVCVYRNVIAHRVHGVSKQFNYSRRCPVNTFMDRARVQSIRWMEYPAFGCGVGFLIASIRTIHYPISLRRT